MDRLSVNTNLKTYDILIDNSFNNLTEEIGKIKDISKIVILSDDQVRPLYSDEIVELLEHNYSVYKFSFKHGEGSKNLTTISDFYNYLIENKIDRKSLLIALGGGVTGDMVGFTAATFMRGIRFIQVPTSLLAQVDSSIGGKTGVDFNGYKNVIGAFYQPELVFINVNTLRTLPNVEFSSGMAEVIKHGLILDKDYFESLIQNFTKIRSLDEQAVAEMIKVSCIIKSKIVSMDERETGARALLNFGHTAGHAIERLMDFKLSHGECVAIGIIVALNISVNRGYFDNKIIGKIKSLLNAYDLPDKVYGLKAEEIYNEMFHDKKTTDNRLNYVLIREIGSSFIDKSVTKQEIETAMLSVLK